MILFHLRYVRTDSQKLESFMVLFVLTVGGGEVMLSFFLHQSSGLRP